MPTLFEYHIFISHAWRYGDEYNNLIRLLDSAPNFKYKNYSSPQDRPLQNLNATDANTKSEIKAAIARKLKPCSCVLVISGMYVAYREWMQYEIDLARIMNKPIIAISPRGNTLMPQAVSSVSRTIVNWNTSSIVSAIRKYSK
ncbi:MAG: TIR domain-containing protein [Lachnospiraceae bacterium]